MTHDDVQRWLDRYIEAWRSYDADAIGDLFAENAIYKFHPWEEDTARGRAAIVAAWRDDRDDPESWDAWYKPFAVDANRAAVVGESRYTKPFGTLRDLYFNSWTLEFDNEGRCVEFVEYFMQLPERVKGQYA